MPKRSLPTAMPKVRNSAETTLSVRLYPSLIWADHIRLLLQRATQQQVDHPQHERQIDRIHQRGSLDYKLALFDPFDLNVSCCRSAAWASLESNDDWSLLPTFFCSRASHLI
jgi:hypothetical protein